MESRRIVKVGIIGCGEVTQVVHIPTLGFLSDLFTVTYLCDVSPESLIHNGQKVINHVPHTTKDASELCASPEVDVVFIASSDEYHAIHIIEGLRHDKNVFVEKPMALCERDADAIIAAEEKSAGKVMVGYMRRYAAAFLDTVKEIGGMDRILYARVRGIKHPPVWSGQYAKSRFLSTDIIGPNSHFVSQSATFPKVFTDFAPEAVDDKKAKAADIVHQALSVDCELKVTPESTKMWRLLGGLGSHDLSAMREALGMPHSVAGASFGSHFWR